MEQKRIQSGDWLSCLRFIVLLLLFLGRYDVQAQRSRVYVDWQLGEMALWQVPVEAYLKEARKTDTLYFLFPEMLHSEEATLRESLPMLQHPQVKLVWNDALRQKLITGTETAIYHTDEAGQVLYKIPLYKAPPSAFIPISTVGRKPLPDSERAISQTAVSGKPISGSDTLRFEGAFPLKPWKFDLSENYLAVADLLTNGLFYYDRKVPRDTVRWNLLRARMLRSTTYRAYFGLPDTASTQAMEDSLEKATAATRFGTNGSIPNISLQGNSIYFYTKYLYLGGFAFNAIVALYELKNGNCYGPWFENAPFHNANDSLWRSTFDKVTIPPGASQEDSFRIENELSRQFNLAHKKLIENSSMAFSFGEDMIAYLGKNLFVLKTANADSQNHRLMAYYQRDDTSLRPIGTVPLYKPELWRENHLGPHMSNLTGHYPYYMLPISNEVYDLKNKKSFPLPVPLGDYDYSPQAAQLGFQFRMGLFIYDVVGNDKQLKVLYSVKEKGDSVHRMHLLHYDLASGKALSQKEYRPGGIALNQDDKYRFDGLERIAGLHPECRCIVFYPAE